MHSINKLQSTKYKKNFWFLSFLATTNLGILQNSLPSSIVSGSLAFFVSGRKRVKIPAINDVKPNINSGAAGLITAISLPIKGARMLPILENVEHDPIPAFLTTVGNISV